MKESCKIIVPFHCLTIDIANLTGKTVERIAPGVGGKKSVQA